MEIKQCLNGLMVYQPAFNEDMCVADFIVKHNHLSTIAAKYRLKTRSGSHLRIFFSQSGDTYKAKHQKNCHKKTQT